MGNSFALPVAEKRLLVIDHITAGRLNEAIQEILKPVPFIFNLDIRFDDKAGEAHEKELLQTVVNMATEHLQGLKMVRKETAKL